MSSGVWGPCCCCGISALWGSNQTIYSQIHKAGLLLHKVRKYYVVCVCLQLCVVFSNWRSSSVWSADLMSACVSCGLYVEECGGVLSRSTAQQNKLYSGFHTELLWLDSLGASVKITLVRLSLCMAGCVQGVFVDVYYSRCGNRNLFTQWNCRNSPSSWETKCKSSRRK